MSKIIVTGAASGLGAAIFRALEEKHYPICFDLVMGCDVRTGLDVSVIPEDLDVLINCAGVNFINWLENVTDADYDAVMDINAKGIFKMSQSCLPILRKNKGTILNIVSNAAHMPMRCSLAYNASKAAALMMTKQMARELSPDVTVFSVSPNKLKGTGMSNSIDEQVVRTRGWTIEKAQQYQLAGLLTGEETPPEAVAEFIAFLLQDKAHHKYLTGCDLQYGC